MEVRHNTKLLEQAIDQIVRRAAIPLLQAEAAAHDKMQRASGFRRLATGVAVALVAVGVGFAIFLANSSRNSVVVERRSPQSTKVDGDSAQAQESAPETTTDVSSTKLPKIDDLIEQSPPPPGTDAKPQKKQVETTNYTIFTTREVDFGNAKWLLKAGHNFKTAADQSTMNWNAAWCYTRVEKDGVAMQLDLSRRESVSSRPSAPLASRETLQKSGVTKFEATALATECPWLDKKLFGLEEVGEESPTLSSPFKLEGNTLTFSGKIDKGFASSLLDYNFQTLSIDSPGGLLDEAIAAGKFLRASKRSVKVKQECLSACVFVLAGGVFRDAEGDSHIGVHRFYKESGADVGDVEFAQQKSAEILRYLLNMGVKDELWFEMAKTPSQTMLYIDHESLRDWGLLSFPVIEVGEGSIAPTSIELDNAPPSQQVSTEDSEFNRLPGTDAPNNDLPNMPLRDISESACLQQCSINQACEAATYNAAHRVCFLKSTVVKVTPFISAVTFYRRKLEGTFVPN